MSCRCLLIQRRPGPSFPYERSSWRWWVAPGATMSVFAVTFGSDRKRSTRGNRDQKWAARAVVGAAEPGSDQRQSGRVGNGAEWVRSYCVLAGAIAKRSGQESTTARFLSKSRDKYIHGSMCGTICYRQKRWPRVGSSRGLIMVHGWPEVHIQPSYR